MYFKCRKTEKDIPGEVRLLIPKSILIPRSQSRMDDNLRPPPVKGIVTFPKVCIIQSKMLSKIQYFICCSK